MVPPANRIKNTTCSHIAREPVATAPRRSLLLLGIALTHDLRVPDPQDTDLHQIIRSSQPLSDDHCQYFIYQARLVLRPAAASAAL